MNVIIDLDLLDENEENPFEKIAAYVEKASLEGKIDESTKDGILKVALSTERKLQDLTEGGTKGEILARCVMEVTKTISATVSLDEDDIDLGVISNIRRGFLSVNKSIDETKDSSVGEIRQRFGLLSPKKYLERKNIKKLSRDDLKKAVSTTLTYFGTIHPNELPIEGIRAFSKKDKYHDIWEIEFIFNTTSKNNHKPLEFLFHFVEIMNKVEGVQFYIEDIKIGSLKAKIKAIYDSAKSKEEVKELLESSRKFAKAKLEKDFEEQQKIKSEKEKIDVEKELLEQQLKENTSIQADYKRALEIQNMEADLRKKQLENLQLELKVLKESRDTFAELLAEGYISQADFEMMIKGIPFMKMIDGRLTIGESTDVIDDL